MNFFKRKSCCYFHSLFSFVGASLVLLVLSSHLVQTVSGLECYICGTQAEDSTDMTRDPCWEKDPLGEPFTVTCDSDHVCAKYASYEPHEKHGKVLVSIWRGCSKRTFGFKNEWKHSLKCGSTTSAFTDIVGDAPNSVPISCFCDTNYCNNQSRVKPSSIIIISLLLAIHVPQVLLKSLLIF